MKDQNETQTFLDEARQYQEDMHTAVTYMKEHDVFSRLSRNGVQVNTHDFIPIVTLMDVKGETKDARTADIHQKLDTLAEVLSEPDREKRDDFLALIYYLIDDYAVDFDPVTMNMNDPAEVAKLLQSMQNSQTIGAEQDDSLREKLDRVAGDPRTEALFGGALGLQNEKTEADLPENLQQAKPALKREAPRHATYQEAKDQLESTATRWDKDSVIGILGQQMTGACDTIRKLILSTAPEKRYEEIAPLFTKVLLYAHLCSDRAANGGEPGEMEKLLATGNSIRENIDSSTRQLATDPVFQELVLERIGGTEGAVPCPECAKFEKMILSGGCEPFWLENKQRLKNLENQKEQPAAAKENQPVQQKQLDIPKITK